MSFPSDAKLTGMVQSFIPDTALRAAPLFAPETCDELYYEFDMIEMNTGLLHHRNPDSVAGIVKLTSKTRKQAKLHSIREKKQFSETLMRISKAPGSRMKERFAARLRREMLDLDHLFNVTNEKLRWDLLTTGAMTLTEEDTTVAYDFGLTNEGTVSAGWDVPASSVPMTDLNTMKETIRTTWGVQPTDLYIGSKALNLFFQSAETAAMLSDATKQEFFERGVVGRLLDLNVIIVDNGYKDAAGDHKYYMSTDGAEADMCIVKAPGTVGLQVEGLAIDSDAPEGHMGKWSKSWTQKDPSGRWYLQTWNTIPGLTEEKKMYVGTLW